MDEKILLKLLQLQFEHQRKLDELAGKINLSYFEIDLLSLVLDAAGVPADNSLAQIDQYGYGGWIEQADTFSRAWYYEEFERLVRQGSAKECRTFLEKIILGSTFQQLLNGSNVMSALIDA